MPSTYDRVQEESTPQLTPRGQKQGEMPPELAEIVAVWSRLPEHIRQTIMTLVRNG
jgi:hypothetical protein